MLIRISSAMSSCDPNVFFTCVHAPVWEFCTCLTCHQLISICYSCLCSLPWKQSTRILQDREDVLGFLCFDAASSLIYVSEAGGSIQNTNRGRACVATVSAGRWGGCWASPSPSSPSSSPSSASSFGSSGCCCLASALAVCA